MLRRIQSERLDACGRAFSCGNLRRERERESESETLDENSRKYIYRSWEKNYILIPYFNYS